MKKYYTIILAILIFQTAKLNAQVDLENSYLLGCENAKNKIAKEYCKSNNFSDLYVNEFSKVLQKYGSVVPEGKATLEFTVYKDGNFGNISYKKSNNAEFSKISLAILNDIFTNFNQFGLKFKPFVDENGESIEKTFQIPIQNQITK